LGPALTGAHPTAPVCQRDRAVTDARYGQGWAGCIVFCGRQRAVGADVSTGFATGRTGPARFAGDTPNAVLSLPDDRLLSLVAILRDTPLPAQAMSPEERRAFLDLLGRKGSARSSRTGYVHSRRTAGRFST